MSIESFQCGKRQYTFESRITKNGHRYVLLTEKSFGRLSKIMVFHDHYETFRSAMERCMEAEPTPTSTSSMN
jgi:hypothetical protein